MSFLAQQSLVVILIRSMTASGSSTNLGGGGGGGGHLPHPGSAIECHLANFPILKGIQ